MSTNFWRCVCGTPNPPRSYHCQKCGARPDPQALERRVIEAAAARIPRGKLALFDNGCFDPRPVLRQIIDGPKHGPLGPAHYAWADEPEFLYQLESLLAEIATEHPEVVRVGAWDGREWRKVGESFRPTVRLIPSASVGEYATHKWVLLVERGDGTQISDIFAAPLRAEAEPDSPFGTAMAVMHEDGPVVAGHTIAVLLPRNVPQGLRVSCMVPLAHFVGHRVDPDTVEAARQAVLKHWHELIASARAFYNPIAGAWECSVVGEEG